MRAANVMASFIILPMSVVLQVEAALILVGRPEFLWAFACLMILVAVLLLRMGFNGFSREALLSREVGFHNPVQRAWGAVRWSFHSRPGIAQLIWLRRIPILIATAGFPIGVAAGYVAGSTSAISPTVVRPVLSSLLKSTGTGGSVQLVISIFAHNLFALVLVAALAVFTVGLSGFVLTFAPGFLLGFAAALSSWTIALTGIVPNGLVEIPAAIIAGGLAIQVGATVIHMDSNSGWGARVLTALADYVRALRWLVPALAVSAVLEVWLG
jgi:uncharacterized membrane protein SpoIIM required for sporulation